jgi:serpin B
MKLSEQTRQTPAKWIVAGIAASAAVAAYATTAGHRTPAPGPPAPAIVAKSPAVHRVAAANTDFAFRLLGQLTAKSARKNVFYSPYSITNALSLALNGAGGETQRGIAKTLGLGSTPIADINRGNSLLLPSLENPDPKVELSVANALWADRRFTLAPSFKKTCRTYYRANATTLDFQSPAAATAINRWVSDNTQGKIDSIATPDLLRSSATVLTNAVYFHGKWTEPFKKSLTQSQPFQLEGGAKKNMPLMTEETTVPYFETDHFQAVALPYGSGRMSFYVILPKSGTTLESVTKSLNAKTWNRTVGSMKPRYLTIFLPRFKAEYNATLNKPLIRLGMATAFGPSADFQPMGLRGAAISAVIHKALIQVDEEGTTAAAVTGVFMPTAVRLPPSTVVRIDHPFFCAIRDNLTGTVLFAGAIYNPQAM